MANNIQNKTNNENAVDQLAMMLMDRLNDSISEKIAEPLTELKDDQNDLRAHVEKLETRTTLEYDEQRLIQREVNFHIHKLLKDESPCGFKKYAKTFYGHLYTGLKNKFCVPSYRAIRRTDLDEAKDFIRDWDPIGGVPALKKEIDEREGDAA